ncbi:NUDIX domain-containing protein [Candidatus Saccharibacteria bacterium]|nr:NUDIX domain-containing protein [Candidatus Saccharibacteria bacterium]
MQKIVPRDATLIPDNATKVFEGEIFDVFQWPQTLYDGSSATFEMLRRPDTTSVICVVDDTVLVLDEEQPGRGKRRSFPGGRVDPEDVDIIASAQREVQEETGYQFKNWRLIKVWQPVAKIEWFIHLVLAWDVLSAGDTNHDAGEKILVEQLTFEQLKPLVMDHVGYLGESAEFFEGVDTLAAILDTPHFLGRQVDR